MKIMSTYSVKIKDYNYILSHTVQIYRKAVDWFINIIADEWSCVSSAGGSKNRLTAVERLTVRTAKRPDAEYDFSAEFYKFPSYLRRAAINEAVGKISAYETSLAKGEDAGFPRAGNVFPAMYRDNMFVRTGTYTARIKVFVNNTWDWLDVVLQKSDVGYIKRHCSDRKECVPTLQRRGKQWFLDFVFEEDVKLSDKPVSGQLVLSVDLGINNACTCCVMDSEGTLYGRRFLSLPEEEDSLSHAVGRIKKAQQHGAKKTPRLWARANGINDDIAVKTAQFIIETAVMYNVDVIVFEYLDIKKKAHGSKKQRLQLWKKRYVQNMVTGKAHRLKMRVSHVCAWNTSRLAFDGSGPVERGTYMQNGIEQYNYSICVFQTGKTYNCDLNAAYNIGARYFIREIIKSVPETDRLALEAKVPPLAKRSTSTLSTLLNLDAELERLAA